MDLTLQLNQMKFLKGNDFRKDIIDNGHLGQGNNRVYNVIMKGKNYALKQVVINQCNIDNEIKIMQSLSKSQYVINLIDYMILEISDNYQQSQQFAYLLMERGQQNLDQFIKDQKQYLENEDLHKILEQLINIFEHLQLQNIAHRDIKLENILLMDLNQLKACDVGCSSQIDQIQTINVVGTQSYLAPELLNAETTKFKHNPFKSDVYSLGLCFLYLITLQLWNQRQKCNTQIEEEIINDYMRHVKRITGDDKIIMKLLKNMLQSNPNERPDFKELKILFIQAKEEQEHQLSKRTTFESFDSPKKSIQQYDYLSPDIITNRGRNTGSNFYQDRQKSAKNLQNNNLSQTKKQQSQTNLLSEGNRKCQASKSPKHSSPSQQIQFSSSFQKPPSANPLKLVQANKQRSSKKQATPSSPINQQSHPGQIRQQSKFYQSVVETKKSNLSFSQAQTLPLIQTLPPNEIKINQDLLLCTYDELSTLYQFQNCVSLQLKNNSIQRKCQLPNDCTILNLKLNNSTPELQLDINNRIQTLILELVEDNISNNNYKWADNLGSMQFPAIDQVEIIQLCKQSQANNIINFLTKIQHVPKICLTIKVEIADQDHRTIMWKLSKYNCSKFEFRIPNIKLKYPVAQLWLFNKQLDELVLDYEDGGLDSAFSFLAGAIRTLGLKKFHFNFSKLQSKNSEICLLFEYLGTNYADTLRDLALSMDYLGNYDKLVQEKLKNNLTKLKNLEKLYLSLVGNGINYEYIERLFNVFDQLNQLKLIILIVDRQFEKQKIRELKKIFPFLNSFTIQFYGTYTNLTIIMHNNEFDKIQNYGINKCNQGKQIKLGQMYYCIKCSKTHSFFLKHMFQICSSCVVSCHSKCDTLSSDQITIGSDSLVQSQIFTFMFKKNHTCIQSFNSQDYKCYCYLLGNCTFTVQNRDRNKHQIQFKCSTCKKNLCRQCLQECHSTHSTIETYITKFKCECECDKHV